VEIARPAVAADHEAALGLLTLALTGASVMRGGTALIGESTAENLLARWTGCGDDAGLWVGEYEGAVVGVLGATVATPVGARRACLIECCYVEAEARGVGVGSTLLETAVAWATSRGCTDVDALALPGDRSTKQRLEGAGFTARLLTLTLSRRSD
jgi:GNAT superfamily N-acetyltransferase